jgi:tyrosinase-like protein
MNNGTQLLVRYEARSPQGQEALQHYSAAVGRMKERNPDEPTSWAYQAAIHGTMDHPLSLQRQCEHESWFFFPWHRIYLYYFERIVRQAVVETGGPADWTLPYWNYDIDQAHAALPGPFIQPAGGSNPLYVGNRNPRYNEGKPLPKLLRAEEEALALREFIGNAMFGGGNRSPHQPRFWGQMGLPERSPHGTVHVEIGGLMGNPEQAAQDPIFWLHHANIDRIWAVWNELEGGANPPESGWTGHRFDFFDADGREAGKTCGEVEQTQLLSYTYDPPPGGTVGAVTPPSTQPPTPAPGAPEEAKIVGASDSPVSLTGESVEVPVEIDARAREEVLETVDPEDPRHLYLNVEDIRGERNPGRVYAMYLNLPPDPGSADYDSHHIGNLAFFGIERTTEPKADEAPHGMRFSVEVGDVVQALQDDPGWDREGLRICFRPVVPGEAEGESRDDLGGDEPVQIGRVSLSIDA